MYPLSCLLFLDIVAQGMLHIVKAELGGHTLFASLVELKALWSEEINTINLMQKLSRSLVDPPNSLQW